MAAAVDVPAAEEGDRLPVAQPHPVEDLAQVRRQVLPALLGGDSADKFWLNLTIQHAPLTQGYVLSFYEPIGRITAAVQQGKEENARGTQWQT